MAQDTPRDSQTIDKVLDAVRENDHLELAQILERNENVDLNHKKDGTYALHLCVGHVECVRVLLEHGAKPDMTNEDKKQPIHLTVERDFVETLMLLVIDGVDFNAKSNGKTPLQIATEEQSQTCQDFLHFLGAKVPDDKLGVFNEEAKIKYEVMQKGFAEGMIVSGGRKIPDNCGHPIQIENINKRDMASHDQSPNDRLVGIGIQGYDDSFMVFVRRLQVEFQTNSTQIPIVPIPEGMELISDIYQYRVDKNVTCDLYVPVSGADRSDRYRELVVVQMKNFGQTTNDVCRNVNTEDGKVVIKGMQLYAHGSSPTVAFGIFSSIRTDRKVVDPNQDLALQSSVEELFKVVVPAGTAPASTEIQLQVMKAESVSQSPDSGIGSHSDFLSVSSVSTYTSVELSSDVPQESLSSLSRPLSATSSKSNVTDDVYIRLPKPTEGDGSQFTVMSCRQGEDATEAGKWCRQENVNIKTNAVELEHAEYANYIVISVKKFGYLIKEYVSDLFARSKGDKQKCKLFAMLKYRENTTEYLVQVVLCRTEDYDERVRDLLKSKFKEQECGPTDDLEINTKCTYMLKLTLHNAKVLGPDALPIQYQGKHPKSQKFNVEKIADRPASGLVLNFKKDVPKKLEYYGKKSKGTLPIWFSECKLESIPNDSFLSDRFIKDIAERMVGEKWFSLGILLGFTCRELCAQQDVEPRKRSENILYKWRDDRKTGTMEERLNNFVLATRQAELPQLRKAIFNDVINFRTNNELATWVRKYGAKGRDNKEIKLNLGLVRDKPVSPLSDKFLLFIARRLPIDDTLFIELDLKDVELEQRISNQEQRKCKLLMLARDKHKEETGFLKALKSALLNKKLKLPVEEISICANKWLNSDEAQRAAEVNAWTKDSLRKIFKL